MVLGLLVLRVFRWGPPRLDRHRWVAAESHRRRAPRPENLAETISGKGLRFKELENAEKILSTITNARKDVRENYLNRRGVLGGLKFGGSRRRRAEQRLSGG